MINIANIRMERPMRDSGSARAEEGRKSIVSERVTRAMNVKLEVC